MSTLQTKGLRSKRRNFPYISQVYVVASRAAERLAGARGKFFLRGPSVYHLRGKKIFRTSTLHLLSRAFISFFYAKFRHLAQKTDILSFARKYLTHKKDWGPTKIFPGPPATRGPGQFAPPAPPPPLSAALVASLYHATKACSCYYGIRRSHFIFAN